jgi:hypothetical protein
MDDYIINRLKLATERKFGRTPLSKSDMEKLSADIFNQTKKLISYNTLRRFFGTIKGTKTSYSVLDVLSEYCDYQNLNIFILNNQPDKHLSSWNSLSDYDELPNDVIKMIKENVLQKDPVNMSNLFYLTKKVVSTKAVEDWSYYYYSLGLDSKIIEENNVLILMANMIGEYLRKKNFSDFEIHHLSNNQLIRDHLIYNFVDYKTLFNGGFYYRVINNFLPLSTEEMIFKYSLLTLKNFTNNNNDDALDCIDRISGIEESSSFFPIINGRISATELIQEIILKGSISEETVESVTRRIKNQETNYLLIYTMEILPILVQYAPLSYKLSDLMDYVDLTINHDLSWNINLDQTMYYTSRLIYHSRLSDTTNKDKYQKLIRIDSILLFYRDYVKSLIEKYN